MQPHQEINIKYYLKHVPVRNFLASGAPLKLFHLFFHGGAGRIGTRGKWAGFVPLYDLFPFGTTETHVIAILFQRYIPLLGTVE